MTKSHLPTNCVELQVAGRFCRFDGVIVLSKTDRKLSFPTSTAKRFKMLRVQLPDVRVLRPVRVVLEECLTHHLSEPRVDRSVAAVHLAAGESVSK